MTAQDLTKMSNEELLDHYSRFMEVFGQTTRWHIELETFYNELLRRLAVYDKYTKAQENIQDLINNQEDCPPEFNQVFIKNMRSLLA